MTAGRGLAVVAASLVTAMVSGLDRMVAQGQQQQTFRAATDVVMVDVSVRDGGRAVTGLTTADFVLTDNGVRQTIESAEAGAVPIDLTLVVDLSGNPRRPVGRPPSPDEVRADLRREVDEVADLLRPDDRVRLFAIDDTVQQVWTFRDASARDITPVSHDGQSSLYDALATALIQSVEPARRHVVIARTKGIDTISSVNAAAIRTIAERSDALFYLVLMEAAFDADADMAAYQCNPDLMGLCWPTRRFWVPFQRRLMGPATVHQLLPDGLTLEAAAQSTGGGLRKTTVAGVPTLVNTFRRAFEDFRNGYMLRYTPQGVARDGWHTIEVRVPAFREYVVRARTGYGVEPRPVTPEPPPVPDVPETLDALVAAYERGAFRQVATGLRQATDPARLIRDFTDAGNPWPSTPRREAAFALELSEAALFSPRSTSRERGTDLLETFTRYVRHPLAPDDYERVWHFAVLSMLEGALRPVTAVPFVDRALARFPAEGRFLLSRAIVVDQGWPMPGTRGPAVDERGRPTEAHVAAVGAAYRAAMAAPDVTVEARVRYAWFLHRLGRGDEALAELGAAAAIDTPDLTLRYLQALMTGHVHAAADRPDEAVTAYRRALTVAPAAQSARVALMNALVLIGDAGEAEALAEAVQTDASPGIDPWWVYWQGQYRFYPAIIARLRELGR